MAQIVKEVALALEKIGLTTVIIPFALTFVILFAVLQKTKVLGKTEKGEAKKKINAIISLVISLFVLAYADTVAVMNRITQYGVVLLVLGILVVIVFAFSGFPKMGETKIMKVLGALVFIVFVFYALGGFDLIEKEQIETKILVPVIGIAAFFIMVYMILKPKKIDITEDKPKKETPEFEEKEGGAPK